MIRDIHQYIEDRVKSKSAFHGFGRVEELEE